MVIDVSQIQHVRAEIRFPLERGSGLGVCGPSLGALLTGGSRSVQHFAFAAVEAQNFMDAPPVLPDHAVVVYGHASRIWQRYLGWRRFIDLGLACLRRVGPALETDERRVVVTNTRAPYAPIGRVNANRVTSEFDSVVLRGIDRLLGLCPAGGDLAVAVGVHDGRAPSLRGGGVAGLVELQRVEPADSIVLAEDERVVFVELVMVRGKAAVDGGELLRLRVIQFDLPCAAARHAGGLRELSRRAALAERRLFRRRGSWYLNPHPSFPVHPHAA